MLLHVRIVCTFIFAFYYAPCLFLTDNYVQRDFMENIYKIILEDTLAGYWDWNIKEGTEYLSPSLKLMFGYEDHEMENKPEAWEQLIFPEDHKKILKCFNEHVVSRGRVPYKTEARYTHKNGNTVWVMCTGRVVEWDGYEPVRMVGCNIDITKQKKAEEALHATQVFLNKTNEVAIIGAWEVDHLKDKVYWTHITRQIHEVDDDYEPVLSEGINFYKEGEHRNRIKEVFGKLVADGISYDEEFIIVTAKGNEKWVRAIGQAEMLDGKVVKTYGTFQDVSRRRKMQNELIQSEQRFRESFENAAIGMALVGLDGTWLRVNKQVVEITGYGQKEILTKTFQEITHPDDLNADLDFVQQLLEGKIDNYQMEKRYFHKYGHIVWVLLSVSLVRTEDGAPVHFVSQIEDITEKKLAQEQLKKTNKELSALFESITHVSVIATDYDGTIKHFSKGAENLLGYTAEEMIDVQSPAIIHVEEEVVSRGKELSVELGEHVEGFDVFVAYAKKGEFESREWTYVRKDGTTFPVQLVVTATKNAEGEITGFLGIATDITKRKEAEETLQNTLNIVSEQNTRLINFAHIVSHNLRSHSGNLELLLGLIDTSETDEEKKEVINHLNGVSSHLSETILHLNDVVTIQTDLASNKERINLKAYINNTIKTLAGDIQQTGVQIINNVPEQVYLEYNKAYLESIILNFMSNGVKYRSLDREGFVKFDYISNSGMQALVIEDNGLGIDLDRYRDKLFGMYKTFHGNDDAKGIGLFITKNQVESMGGKIDVESEVNKGTKFTITF